MAFDGKHLIVDRTTRKGQTRTINSQTFKVYDSDSTGVTEISGAAVPSDGGSGFAIGCKFRLTTGNGVGTTEYTNEGSASSCDFNSTTLPETGDISSVTAGNGLSGGGASGAVSLAVVGGRGVAVRSAGVDVGVAIYNGSGGDYLVGTLVNLSGFNTTLGITVTKADADAGIRATHVILDVISNGTAGVAYPVGRATAQNTGGRTIGDLVYVDATTAGGFTFTAPTGADQMVQIVGVVKVVDASVGEIEFFPGSGHITKFATSMLQDGAVSPAKQTTAARTRVAVIPFKLPAPTGSNQGPFTLATFALSQAFTVVGVKIGSDLATTGSDATNQYQFQARNLTGAADLHTGPSTTQGAELSASIPKTVTVSQNLAFTANQVFGVKVDIADDGSAGPTNLSGAQLYAILEYTI